jgi:hypothetical protein
MNIGGHWRVLEFSMINKGSVSVVLGKSADSLAVILVERFATMFLGHI